MNWGELIERINRVWPLSDAEHWDNCGMSVGGRGDKVERILISLDLTNEVLNEAIKKKVDGIITHHPLIFSPLKKIDSDSYSGNIIFKAIKNGINLLSLHTNLDVAPDGPSFKIAEGIGLKKVNFLQPTRFVEKLKLVVFVPKDSVDKVRSAMAEAGAGIIGNYRECSFQVEGCGTFLGVEGSNPSVGESGRLEMVDEVRLEMEFSEDRKRNVIDAMKRTHPYEEVAYDIYRIDGKSRPVRGMGAIGEYEEALGIDEVANRVMEYLAVDSLVLVDSGVERIRKVAVVSGSGTSMMHRARTMGAQLLITGDVKHHQAIEARDISLSMIDATHYGTEKITKKIIEDKLSNLVGDEVVFLLSTGEIDPMRVVGR